MTGNKQKHRVTIENGISPTRERHFHNGGLIAVSIAGGVNRYRAVYECALDIYLERKIIAQPQYQAGLRFKEAYHHSVSCRTASKDRGSRYSNFNIERLTMSEKMIQQANNELDDDNWNVVEGVCGHDQVVWSPKALESLRKGLGHLAIKWHMSAIEICEHKKKD